MRLVHIAKCVPVDEPESSPNIYMPHATMTLFYPPHAIGIAPVSSAHKRSIYNLFTIIVKLKWFTLHKIEQGKGHGWSCPLQVGGGIGMKQRIALTIRHVHVNLDKTCSTICSAERLCICLRFTSNPSRARPLGYCKVLCSDENLILSWICVSTRGICRSRHSNSVQCIDYPSFDVNISGL